MPRLWMFAIIRRMCSLTNVERGGSADKIQPRNIKVSLPEYFKCSDGFNGVYFLF
jgi:hypothetical protein